MYGLDSIKELDNDRKTVGVKQSIKAIEEGRVSHVFLAKDAEDKILKPILELCEKVNVIPEYINTMRELGNVCGIDVDASVACILKSC